MPIDPNQNWTIVIAPTGKLSETQSKVETWHPNLTSIEAVSILETILADIKKELETE